MRIGSMKVKNSRILLPRVRFYAHHGVDPQEQLTGAYFHVGIEADTDFNEAMQTDRLEGTVSYADLYESIKTEMDIPSKLLEHVAGRILQRLFDDFTSISRIRLTLTKENPPMGADCREAGVEIEAER